MPKTMSAASGGGGRQRGRRVTSSLSEINVIPLVDVMLVLLIISILSGIILPNLAASVIQNGAV